MAAGAKEPVLAVSAEIFGRQGYEGTGLKQIVTAAKVSFGSLYHFFPGGTKQLGAEAIRVLRRAASQHTCCRSTAQIWPVRDGRNRDHRTESWPSKARDRADRTRMRSQQSMFGRLFPLHGVTPGLSHQARRVRL